MDTDVTIRPLAIEDATAMAQVLSSPELYTHIGGQPPTAESLSDLYARQTVGRSPDGTQEWLNWVVLDSASDPVGYVQASRLVDGESAEIAWVIGRPWQGRGRATAAVRLMVAELADRGVGEVTACIHPDNVPSVGVARRIGMRATDRVVDGETCWVGVAKGDSLPSS